VAATGTASPKRGTGPLPAGNHCDRQSATPSSKRTGLSSAASNCPGSGAKRTKPKQSATVQKTVKVRINKTRTGDGGPFGSMIHREPRATTWPHDTLALDRYYLNFELSSVLRRFRICVDFNARLPGAGADGLGNPGYARANNHRRTKSKHRLPIQIAVSSSVPPKENRVRRSPCRSPSNTQVWPFRFW